jgi:tetratricopeptide (TPR) repeat protein
MSETASSRKKRVFISATTHDLKSYRNVVTEWARVQNYEPIVQDEFPTHSDYYTVRTLLRDKISLCDAVIHLAGLYYGAEPGGNNSPETRRSYTQLEYDVSRALRKQIITLIANEKYKPDNSIEDQPDQLAQLQSEHRARIKANKSIYHSFKDIPELQDKLTDVVITDTIAKPNNLPAVGSLFKGRDEFLKQLRAKVESKSGSALVIATKQTIHGLGGIGKTRLAIEYANRYSEHYNALLFIAADSPQNLKANIANLCGALGIYEPEPVKQYRAAINWLQEHPGWLLIVDSVNNQEAAKAVEESILSKLKEGHIVVTSRLSTWKNRDLDELMLDVISKEASVDLLLEGTWGRRKSSPAEQEDVRNLAERLGCLPIALQQAVGFIVTRRCSFADYLERWKKTDEKVIEWHDEYELKYPRSIASTWKMSFDEMESAGKDLLKTISWLAPAPIPLSLFEMVSKQPNPIDVEAGIAELEKYSFLRWVDDDSEFFQVHELVSQISRYTMGEKEREATIAKSLAIMKGFVENHDPSNPMTWHDIFRPCCAHIKKLIGFSDKYKIGIEESSLYLMNAIGCYLHSLAEFDEAERIFRGVLEIGLQFRENHTQVIAPGMNNLARLLQETGRCSEAEPLFQKALEIYEKSDCSNNLGVAAVLNNHSTLLLAANRHSEAEPLIRRAIQILESFHGPQHPELARVLSTLAISLYKNGCQDEAEKLFRRALKIDEELLGPSHPSIATRLNNLAVLLMNRSRNVEAETLLRRALCIDDNWYGSEHPNVARVLNNLAHVLQENKMYDEAERSLRRAISIDELSYGPSHPYIATGLNNLAKLMQNMERHREAEFLFRRALQIAEAVLGKEHEDTSKIRNNLAFLLVVDNRQIEAEFLYRRAIDIREHSLGGDGKEVAVSLNNLAVLLMQANRKSEAEQLLSRACAILGASVGPDHLNTITASKNLSNLLREIEVTGGSLPKD